MEAREETFRRLYAAHFDAVLGYALRRTDRPEDAADVVAETFVVAWRRIAHVPVDGSLPWLYAVARRLLANQRRGELRRRRLGDRLRRDLAIVVPDISDDVVQRGSVDQAMARLSARDEEILQLHLWEQLEPREIADVLGLSPAIVRPRLSRARARLRAQLGDVDPPDLEAGGNEPDPAGHIPGKQPIPNREEER